MDQKIDLSYFFRTKIEALDFSERLSGIVDQMYLTDFDLEKALTDKLGITKKDKFMVLLRDNNIGIATDSGLKDFLSKILKDVAAMETVTLTLPIEPAEKMLKAVVDWFMLNTAQQVLLEIVVSPGIVAGAKINFKGKYVDFSENPKIEEIVNRSVVGDINGV